MNPETTNSIKICHISDLHLPLTQSVPREKFLGKRLLGYANLRLNRGQTHKRDAFEALLAHLVAAKPSLTVISGDMVNLALDFEFKEVADILTQNGFTSDNLFIIPGNHDRYTPGAWFRNDFEKYLASWLPKNFRRNSDYPLSKKIGPILLVGLDTATWRGPIRAAGRLSDKQQNKLIQLLDDEGKSDTSGGSDTNAGVFPIIVMHHPPFEVTGKLFKHYRDGLEDCNRIFDILGGRKAAILHGHIHRRSRIRVDNTEVFGVPSASNDTGQEERQLAYHTYTITGTGVESAVATVLWPGASPQAHRFETVDIL